MRTNNIITQTGFSPQTKKGGFTLIEVIAVLVLLGILAAIALPKYIDMTEEAKERAIDAGISELNGREALAWGKAMIDDATFADPSIDTVLGGKYTVDTTASPNTIAFDGLTHNISRTSATTASPGFWVDNGVPSP